MSPPTKTFKCGSCNDNINKNQTSIQCKECALWFHITCAKIPEKVLSALKDSRLSFTCTSCNNDPRSGFETMLRNEISSLNCKIDDFINKVDSEQTSIKNALADTVASLKSEIASCLKEMKSEIVDCNKLINNVEISTSNKITALEEENNCLHRRLNRTNIIVTGLPAGIDDLMPVIMKLGTIFDVPICTYDLQYICYMNNRKSILVKFNSIFVRDKIMSQYFKTRSLKVRDFVDGDVDLRVYLNDHYSPAASRLNMICKKLLRKDLIKKFRIMNSDRLRVKLTLPDDSEVVYSPSQCADLLDDGPEPPTTWRFYNDMRFMEAAVAENVMRHHRLREQSLYWQGLHGATEPHQNNSTSLTTTPNDNSDRSLENQFNFSEISAFFQNHGHNKRIKLENSESDTSLHDLTHVTPPIKSFYQNSNTYVKSNNTHHLNEVQIHNDVDDENNIEDDDDDDQFDEDAISIEDNYQMSMRNEKFSIDNNSKINVQNCNLSKKETKEEEICRHHDEQDSDRMFLLSLLPYLRKVKEQRKLQVRQKLQDVLIQEFG